MIPAIRIKVLLVVGNHLLSKALGRILQKRPDMSVIGQSADISNLAQVITPSESDVILLDSVAATALIRCSGMGMRDLNPNAQVLMIGMDADECAFLKAVRAGVRGYLLNEASAADVLAAIRSVARGEAVCPPRLGKALFDTVAGARDFIPNLPKTAPRLTRRQQELVPMIARGLTNKEIASHLNLSEQTVKNHVHRMLRKMGASDRLQVTEIAGVEGFPT
jgi:two-component system, NarL family, nitrate/nitrite response regulator NarL